MSNPFLEQQEEANNSENLVIYLNGILTALEILNEDRYTGNTYYFSKVENYSGDYEKSIITHLNLPKWSTELTQTENFYLDLDQTLTEFCQSYALHVKNEFEKTSDTEIPNTYVPNILERTNYSRLKDVLTDSLKLILGDRFEAYSVRLIGKGWYEAVYNDYFIVSKNEYFYFHFGISD